MYPVPDDDLNLLENYLDDALSDEQIDALRGRLAVEPSLAAGLRLLRDERTQRQAFFQSIEPSPAQVNAFVESVHSQIDRKVHWAERLKTIRFGSALAACLVVGVCSGLYLRATPSAKNIPSQMRAEDAVDLRNASQRNFTVPLTDNSGHVIAEQHFDNQNDASDFARDLRLMQEQHSGSSRSNSHEF